MRSSLLSILALSLTGCDLSDNKGDGPSSGEDTAVSEWDYSGAEIHDYIDDRYVDQPSLASSLHGVADSLEAFLAAADDSEASRAAIEPAARALECLMYTAGDDGYELLIDVQARTLDTRERTLDYLDAMSGLGGATVPLRHPDDWADSCDGLGVGQSARAADGEEESCLEDPGTVIVFGNGMNNPGAKPMLGAAALVHHVAGTLEATYPDEVFRYELSLNYDELLFLDLFEAADQILAEEWTSFWMGFADVFEDDALQQVFTDWATASMAIELAENSDLQEHLQRYRSHILQGNRVVVISHSQGNLFANEAYQLLHFGDDPVEAGSFGLVGVASPAGYVAGGVGDDGDEYVTVHNDLIIKFLPTALDTNIENGDQSGEDSLHHDFQKTYLRGDVTGPRITEMVVERVGELEHPEALASEGIITVTLAWGDEPDVDLHVYEPDGGHVYYSDQSGTSGYLDHDDVDGYGPEHYFVPCDGLAEGTYQIGVNYYSGDAPEQATVQVQAGYEVQSYSVQLSQDRGSDGNDSPVMVAELIAVNDPQDGWSFTIAGM